MMQSLLNKKYLIIALVAYCLISLGGDLSSMVFILWLFLTAFLLSEPYVVFAWLALIGIGLNFTFYEKYRGMRLLAMLFMLAPIIQRLAVVELEKFNYPSFYIPLGIFVLAYVLHILTPVKTHAA